MIDLIGLERELRDLLGVSVDVVPADTLDAVRVRLIEIGEAVKDIAPDLLESEGDVPWGDIARMRDHLAHRYFDTAHSTVKATVEGDLPPLVAATRRMVARLGTEDEEQA